MAKIHLKIPGQPRGKGRPRFTKTGQVVTPKETVEAEKLIRRIFNEHYPRHKPFLGPVMVRMTAVFPVPKSFTVAQRNSAMRGEMYCTSKPDKDNIEKLVYDALNGLAWDDDSQCSGGCVKRYGSPARVDITIEELSHPVPSQAEKRRVKKSEQPEFVLGRPVRKWK